MAIFHAHKTSYSRGRGYLATKLAAYRACERIKDNRTQETADYKRKRALVAKGIVAPGGADIDISREQLWNDVEKMERRKASTVAQEWEIALPVELSTSQQLDLARDLAIRLADADNTLADYCIHKPHKKSIVEENGEKKSNPHVHILMPTRQWKDNALSKERVVEYLSTDDRKKLGITTKRTEDVTARREMIAICINEHLERARLNARVDHRSLEAQGINRQPQIHVGTAAAALERRGEKSERIEINRQIIAENKALAEKQAEIAQNRPEIDFNESLSFTPSPTTPKHTSRTRARDEKPKKREQVQKPELPQLPMNDDLASLVSRDDLEAAAELSADFPKPDNMSFEQYWAQIREALAKQEELSKLTEAQLDLLACAATDAENPSHHPSDEIRAAICAKYGATDEARKYAESIERQGRSDASIVTEKHDELRHIDD